MTLTVHAPLRRAALLLLVVGLLPEAGGCAITFDARTLGASTTMSARATEQPQGESFRISKKAVYVLWGVGAASRPSLERVLEGQVTGEAQVANLRVHVSTRFGDLITSVLTLGLVIPRTVTYEGVIVRPTPPSGQ